MTQPDYPRVRLLDRQPVRDGAWEEMLGAARFWRSHGAPFKAISQMVADDYGVELDERTLARILNGRDVPRRPGH